MYIRQKGYEYDKQLTCCFDFVAVYTPSQLRCKYDCILNRRPICAFELLIAQHLYHRFEYQINTFLSLKMVLLCFVDSFHVSVQR